MNEESAQLVSAPHLIDEPPMLVLPSLAVLLGINKAIMLQQLHFLLNTQRKAKNKYNFIEGRWWVYNSYPEWQREQFPWLAVSTLKRLFLELEESSIILSKQSVKHKSDRRKWYSIDYDSWANIQGGIVSKRYYQPLDQNDTTNGSKRDDGLSETTTETEEKDSASYDAGAKSEKPKNKIREPDPLFDAVKEHVFKITDPKMTGGRIAKIANWLKGKYEGPKGHEVGLISQPVEIAHVLLFAKWWSIEYPGAHAPLDFVKFVEHWRHFASRSTTRHKPKTMSQREVVGIAPRMTKEEFELLKENARND